MVTSVMEDIKIRLLQEDKNTFWIQTPKKLFGRTCWITLRNTKKYFRTLVIYYVFYAIFPFIIYGVGSLFSSDIEFLKDSLELLTSSYSFWCVLWGILFSFRDSRIKVFFNDIYNPNISTKIRYNKKVIKIYHGDLVKSGKRTIFGKVKDVYYMNKKDLRKQKLEKLEQLKSLF